jgi:hypothetical protein
MSLTDNSLKEKCLCRLQREKVNFKKVTSKQMKTSQRSIANIRMNTGWIR